MTTSALRHRPIFGGVFGQGRYSLATLPCIAHGLHAVKFMVIEPSAGNVLSMALDKREALGAARKLLRAAHAITGAGAVWGEAANQPTLWAEEELPLPDSSNEPAKRVSRRRREVFERSGGRCHYCDCALTLDGAWHVEHQLPRALGGSDDIMNLVAACAPCNLAKSDRTALEFVLQQNRPATDE